MEGLLLGLLQALFVGEDEENLMEHLGGLLAVLSD